MEHTGRYYESVALFLHGAGFFVSALNPLVFKDYQDGITVRRVKTDKVDAAKIARFALDNWELLREYTLMVTTRYELKILNRQFQLTSKNRTSCSNNLVALLEQSFPGNRSHFSSTPRADGSQKWVDFVGSFWHLDCVRDVSLNAFTERYQKWCARHGYQFSSAKAAEIYADAKNRIALVPKSDVCKMMVKEAVAQLNTVSHALEAYRAEMNRLASQLPEYDTVMGMYGVG